MGFGILLIGYLFNLNFVAKQGIFWCAASLIMLYALTRLFEYNEYFKKAFYACAAMTVLSLAAAGLEIYELFIGTEAMKSSFAGEALSWLLAMHPIFMGAFTYLLILAIRDIGRETEATVVYQRAVIQKFLCPIFYIPMTLLNLSLDIPNPPMPLTVTINVLYVLICVFGLVFISLNARMIFSCYAWICLPEDYYMETRREKRERELDEQDLTDGEDEAPSSDRLDGKLPQNMGKQDAAVHPNKKGNAKNRGKRR